MPNSKSSSPSYDQARDAHVGRVLNEYLDQKRKGQQIPESEFLAQHADIADQLKAHLGVVRDLSPDEDPIQDLLDRGILAESTSPGFVACLGDYTITRFVGAGGMGIVLEARQPTLNRRVALKILHPNHAHDRTAVDRFAREARAAGGLRHPNITTVHAVGHHNGTSFIAMEFIEGPTLAELIRARGPLSTGLARRILRELLAGLAAAHEDGLIHRDIGSSNILLDGPNHQAKIADFGLARITGAETRMTLPNSILGTPEYMSPEQARGDATNDHRTDLYSAGVVLDQMLTARTPFRAETPTATIHRILHDAPLHPRTIHNATDPHLASLALRLMAKSPTDRPPSAVDALAALDGGERAPSPGRGRRARGRLAVGLLASAALACSLWVLNQLPSQLDVFSAPSEYNPGATDVKVHERSPTQVLVERGYGSGWEELRTFPAAVEAVHCATLVAPTGTGRKIVVVALKRPFKGANVFALDVRGEELWRINLSSPSSIIHWPDSGPLAQWECRLLEAADLNGEPGDELVAVARDPQQYPTRITVMDPRNGMIHQTFWHFGHVNEVRVLNAFFDDGRPALLAWATNNKLDGFHDGLRPDERRFTQWDLVHAVMILDPLDMEGVGPPPVASERLPGLCAARPYAYAFLDLAHSEKAAYVPEEQGADEQRPPKRPRPDQIAGISSISDAFYTNEHGTGPWFDIHVALAHDSWRAPLTVDRNLELCHIGPYTDRRGMSDQRQKHWDHYWKTHWRPIIQNRTYVAE